ncbi:MAG: hypothetical protein GX241_05100 [Ruminococcaceae bacterium]|nr:hypothetical protein [Oscillospiraceae bacterium]
MKRRVTSLLIALIVILSSVSTATFAYAYGVNTTANQKSIKGSKSIEQKSVCLTVGSDENSRNITWYAKTMMPGTVQYAPKSTMVGNAFPAKYREAKAISRLSNDTGFYTNQATMDELKANTEYVYRFVNGEQISKTYTFKTGDVSKGIRFAVVGDPQIGSGDLEAGIAGWEVALNAIQTKLNVDFLISAGDQVNTSSSEIEYAGFLNERLASLALAPTIGNHDNSSTAYGQHFNIPNESAIYGRTLAGANYWYVYGNTLFMHINSNSMSTIGHEAFLKNAIEKNPDAKWKIVVFHHSIYSTAGHWDDPDIISRRNSLPPILNKLGIDVVFMGHDHIYTRSYMMNGTTPDSVKGPQSEVVAPTGVLYITGNSGSGSKYYGVAENFDADYAAKIDQSKRPTAIEVSITDTEYTMTTYFTDDMSVLDKFTIRKTANINDPVVDNPNTDEETTGNNGSTNNTNGNSNGNTSTNNNADTGVTVNDKTPQSGQSVADKTLQSGSTVKDKIANTGDVSEVIVISVFAMASIVTAVAAFNRKKILSSEEN